MAKRKSRVTPHQWIEQVFSTKLAKSGGIVRRSISSVVKSASVDEFLQEAKRRGFHVIMNGSHFVVICNNNPVSHIH